MDVTYFDVATTEQAPIPCKLFAPDGGMATTVVLAVHGFAGDKESSAIAAIADATCPLGWAVCCFDLPAHGTHPSSEFSLDACREALLAVAEHVQRTYPQAKKAMFATSFGGYLTLLSLTQLQQTLGSFGLVLRAPAVRMVRTFEESLLGESIDDFLRAGTVRVGFERMLDVPASFLLELREQDVCMDHGRPMLVIHGNLDDLVTQEDIASFMRANPQAELVEIAGADHRFKGPGEIERVVDEAVRYLSD